MSLACVLRLSLSSIHVIQDFEIISLVATFPSITWRESEIRPVGFGVSKLVLKCLADSKELDDLCGGLILDVKGEDAVQSFDID